MQLSLLLLKISFVLPDVVNISRQDVCDEWVSIPEDEYDGAGEWASGDRVHD